MDGNRESLIFIVGQLSCKARIDQWLCTQLQDFSRSQVQSLIKQKAVLLNQQICRARDLVKTGDHIIVHGLSSNLEAKKKLIPTKIDLNVIYEDDDLIVINKPAGLTVHPGAGTKDPTLVEGLLDHFLRQGLKLDISQLGGKKLRPFIVHRLDKDTSGVMICAKTVQAYSHLMGQFAKKTNTRSYLALLNGILPTQKVVHESYLYRDPKNRLKFASLPLAYDSNIKKLTGNFRLAKSEFHTLAIYAHHLSLVKVFLYTGRTHQIRIHSADLKASVLGDKVYGKLRHWPKIFSLEMQKTLNDVKRQMLHAEHLGIEHPTTGQKMIFEAPIPQDFANLVEKLSEYKISF